MGRVDGGPVGIRRTLPVEVEVIEAAVSDVESESINLLHLSDLHHRLLLLKQEDGVN